MSTTLFYSYLQSWKHPGLYLFKSQTLQKYIKYLQLKNVKRVPVKDRNGEEKHQQT